MQHRTLSPAGNFFSAAFEDHCEAVAGASGGIFGLLGLFIADMVLNFETLTRSVRRHAPERPPLSLQPCFLYHSNHHLHVYWHHQGTLQHSSKWSAAAPGPCGGRRQPHGLFPCPHCWAWKCTHKCFCCNLSAPNTSVPCVSHQKVVCTICHAPKMSQSMDWCADPLCEVC